jgi:transcriptional regulator with XRE-family HTH domain
MRPRESAWRDGDPGDEAEELRKIGARLKVLRKARGLTLREVAERAGLSASFVSMVENGRTEIAISRLVRLTGVCGASVADVLSEAHEPRVEYAPLEDALRVPVRSPGVDLRYLASPSWEMEPFLLRLSPHARLEGLRHPTQEVLYCIEGSPCVIVDEREYGLSPTDTLLLPESAEHAYHNDGPNDALLLGVVRTNTDSGVPLLHELIREHGTS